MLYKPQTCSTCELYDAYGCKTFIHPEGTGSLGVMIVGEAAGEMEALEGLPFRPSGDSGAVLERVWSRCGWTRDQFRITNMVHCRPPGNKLSGESYEVAAIASCRQYLDAEIREFKPRAILALGGVATAALTGMTGHKQGIESIQGFPLRALDYDIPVIPALHPAFIRRGKMSWLGLLILHMRRAVEIARTGMVTRPPAKYNERASLNDLEAFRDEVRRHPELLLSYDIETDYSLVNDENDVVGDGSNIVLVQFSLRPGTGIATPWEPRAVSLIQDILASPNEKVGHNSWMFDTPMLQAHGVDVAGLTDDSMWAYHHLQPDLPRGLQSVASVLFPEFGPWKHESGIDLNAYGCKDVDVLQTLWPKIKAELQSKDLWRGYERHVKRLWPILCRMSQHGIPIDREEQGRFKAYLEEQMAIVDTRLQAAYPEHLKNVDPKLGFAKTPKDLKGLVQREFTVPFKVKAPCYCVDIETGEIRGWEGPKIVGPDGKKVGRYSLLSDMARPCMVCKGRGWIKVPGGERVERRWARLLPFKPSQDQLIRYIKYRKHRVPKAIGENRETTAKLFIDRLAKDYKDPFYSDNLELRGYQKQLGSYIWTSTWDQRDYEWWPYVHPKFTYTPASGQLAALHPNVMTIPAPKGKKDSIGYHLATRFRKTIVARPGYALVAIDFSGFHTSTFAFEAQDEAYFRLANKLRDPHSFLAAVMLEKATADEMLAWDDEKLLAFLGSIKKEHKALRDGQAKPGILGYALGLGGNKLFEQNRWDGEAGFRKKSDADACIATLRRVFPKGYKYQKAVQLKAHVQHYLKNHYGFIRWFWDVFHYDARQGGLVPGDQAEAAIAFDVQCDAHGYIKEAILRMEAMGWLERYGLCNIVHDEVFFECPLGLLEELLANVLPEMEKPSEVLKDAVLCPNGLVVAAEPSIGWNRAEMMSPGKFLDELAKGAKGAR